MKFGVITEVPNDSPAALVGNLATALGQVFTDRGEAINPMQSLMLRVPVFTLGEILVLDDDGREIAGAGRKPDKWDVRCETFDEIGPAVERAKGIVWGSVVD
jgi:hypothetical protein